jgi:cell division protein FtsZ
MTTIRRYAADEAHVIYGTAYDESLGDALRVTVIATGLASAGKQQQQQAPQQRVAPMQVVQPSGGQRTGTDNIPVLTHPLIAPSHANAPSVWRPNRTQASAKVDALAANGMDEIEIPAFLRKQAD